MDVITHSPNDGKIKDGADVYTVSKADWQTAGRWMLPSSRQSLLPAGPAVTFPCSG